jgi:hypothetical protein
MRTERLGHLKISNTLSGIEAGTLVDRYPQQPAAVIFSLRCHTEEEGDLSVTDSYTAAEITKSSKLN